MSVVDIAMQVGAMRDMDLVLIDATNANFTEFSAEKLERYRVFADYLAMTRTADGHVVFTCRVNGLQNAIDNVDYDRFKTIVQTNAGTWLEAALRFSTNEADALIAHLETVQQHGGQ